ncbi:MAG: metallophosphoesterase [Bryobacteraceae bacterium]|nr:metallophosphoesterase [Bryobacteraceae bacterium]
MKNKLKCLSLFLAVVGWGEGGRDLGQVAAGSTVRAVVIGDFGETGEDSGQEAVAKAIRGVHETKRFHIGLTVGDNFYPSGVKDAADPHWKSEFHEKYDALGIRFFATLGNHDYRGNAQAQVDYTNAPGNRTWQMPARYYTFAAGPVRFFALDTDEGTIGLFQSKPWSDEQSKWLEDQLARHAAARWKVVYGHHPIFSDGHHGDEKRLKKKLLPVLQAHKVDVYLAGHDHDMQHFEQGGIQFFVVGGGGAGTRKVKRKRADFAEQTHGFLELEAGANQMELRMAGADGRTLYSRTLKK